MWAVSLKFFSRLNHNHPVNSAPSDRSSNLQALPRDILTQGEPGRRVPSWTGMMDHAPNSSPPPRGLSKPGSRRRKVMDSPSLLVVDDDDVFRERLGRAIAGRGYSVRTAGSADEAVALATQAPPQFAVLDLRMPGDDGLVVLRRLRELAPDLRAGRGQIAVPVIEAQAGPALEAVHLGALNYLTKPADVDDVLAALYPEGQGAQNGAPARMTSLAKMAWEQIHRIMQESGGDVHEAARRLGMSRRTLQRRAFRQRPAR